MKMVLTTQLTAAQVVGYRRAKWSKTQPHKGILWTTKFSRGVNGSDKSYIAFSPSKRKVVWVGQFWNSARKMVRWHVAGQYYDSLDEAKQVAKDMLDD